MKQNEFFSNSHSSIPLDDDLYAVADTHDTLPSSKPGSKEDENHAKLMFLFLVMGLGILFPYSSLISSVDYFTTIHPDPNDAIISQISSSLLASLLISTCILTYVLKPNDGHDSNVIRRRLNTLQSPQERIVVGFILEAFIFMMLIFLPKPSIFMCNLIAVLVGLGDALNQSGLYEFAASIHPQYTAALTLGSAVAGIIVNILKMLTKVVFQNNLRLDMGFFFSFNIVVVLGCIMALRHTLAIVNVNDVDENAKNAYDSIPISEDDSCIADRINSNADGKGEKSTVKNSNTKISNKNEPSFLVIPNEDETVKPPSPQSTETFFAHYWKTIWITWKPLAVLFINFFITLSLFPGPVISMKSNTSNAVLISFGSWLPIVLITTFNICDCLGRFILNEFKSLSSASENVPLDDNYSTPSSTTAPTTRTLSISDKILFQSAISTNNCSAIDSRFDENNGSLSLQRAHLPNFNVMVFYPSLLRVFFFPIIYLCIKSTMSGNSSANLNFFISDDLGRLIIIALFGLSNGFIATACFMAGPTFVPKTISNHAAHRDTTSLLLLLTCFSGLAAGSFFSLALNKWFLSI